MKTKIYMYLLAGMMVFNACELTEEPYGFYSEDNFYNTVEDAEAAITYAYDALTFLEYSRGVFFLGDLPTDQCGPKSDEGADAQQVNSWTVESFSRNNILQNYFKYAYIAINRVNTLMEALPASSIEPDQQEKYIGEARFLRAWNYFNLVKNFGLVPIHKSAVTSLDNTEAPMADNLDQLYDLILADCRLADELLEIGQATGRADKVAAQSLAAKAYLHIASSIESGVPVYADMARTADAMYDSAAYFAGLVVSDQNVYGFDTNLIDIYDVDLDKGTEHIFLMSMDRSGTIEGDFSKISKLFIPYISGNTIYMDNGDGSFTASHDGWSVFQTLEAFYNTFDAVDARGQELLVDVVYNEDGTEAATYPGAIPYRFTRKYVDPDFIADKTSTKPFLLRFSDIALIYAEAAGPTAEAYSLVNTIRNRAGLGDLTPGLSLADFRESVINERAWELMYEGNRLYDLRRLNRVVDLVDEANGLTPEQAAFYPIPQRELDLNKGL